MATLFYTSRNNFHLALFIGTSLKVGFSNQAVSEITKRLNLKNGFKCFGYYRFFQSHQTWGFSTPFKRNWERVTLAKMQSSQRTMQLQSIPSSGSHRNNSWLELLKIAPPFHLRNSLECSENCALLSNSFHPFIRISNFLGYVFILSDVFFEV